MNKNELVKEMEGLYAGYNLGDRRIVEAVKGDCIALVKKHLAGEEQSSMTPNKDWSKATLQEIVEQLEWCGYGREGGTLGMNVAFIELKKRAKPVAE